MSYNPTNWKKGDKVTSNKLNKIEQGIKGLDDTSPVTTESTVSNVDLDLTDENGNVLLRLKDGHIATKNFNSESISDVGGVSIKNSNSDSDVDIADESGNVIARFRNGHIETKEFRGFKYITFSVSDTYKPNADKTVTIYHHFKKGDKIVLHTDRGEYPYNTPWNTGVPISYYEDDRVIVEDSRVDIAYLEHTITQDTDSISATYKNGTYNYNTPFVFNVSLLGDIPIEPTIITIKKDGTGDYTNIKSALADIGIQANDVLNPYRIEIYEGTYDVLDDYTDEEIGATVSPYTELSFVGAKILNGMSIVGMGKTPNEVVLNGYLDTTKWNSTIRGQISTLNLQGSCSLENLTIIGTNLRYCVHDDFASINGKPIKRKVKNCIFRGYNTAYTPHTTYGAGMPVGGMNAEFIDCDFGENGGVHLNTNMINPVTVHLINCKGHGFRIGDNITGVSSDFICDYIFDGCDFSWIGYRLTDTVPHINIRGTGNTLCPITAPESVLYNLNGMIQVPLSRLNLNVGDLVEKYSTSEEHGARYRVATSLDNACGIVVYKDSNDAYIQYDGYVRTDRAGILTCSMNDYVGFNNGKATIVQSADSSFGRIKYIDVDGYGYIELRWR